LAVFDAAFETLWEPKNAQKDEEQLYAAVGKKHGLTGAEVQAIYRRNETEADRRLKARGEAESRALNSRRR
jgi:2-hydroxychromene-2-carboxylate isomerase